VKRRAAFVVPGLAVLALGAVFQACAPRGPAHPRATIPLPPRAATILRVQIDRGVDTVALEDYVAGCVGAELGSINLDPPAAARARDVQAVLCRSYALASVGRHADEGFDLCATTHCQVFRPVPATVIGRLCREAAARTADRVLRFAGRAVVPNYHADCGGHTSTPEEVWGSASTSFLVSATDEACPRRPAWRLDVTLRRLGDVLRADPVMATVGPLRSVEIERRDASGRAAWIRLNGRQSLVVRGADFRAAVLRGLGSMSLPSTLFRLATHAGTVKFEGHGNGHGVGLCQAGMIARAGRGDTPAEILAHYFPGTTVGVR
jgi:stage II sporulation protein D